MPIAYIHIIAGRTDAQKANAIAAVTKALSETLDSPKERIRVLIQEVPPAHWGIAGVAASERG